MPEPATGSTRGSAYGDGLDEETGQGPHGTHRHKRAGPRLP
ncbi:hypothetical protein [Streptomyces sp. TSRI0107]|nr:hypothetical protein [Streptomyces sp. TSRI0107]